MYGTCNDEVFLPVHMLATTEKERKMSSAQSGESAYFGLAFVRMEICLILIADNPRKSWSAPTN